MPNTKYNGWTNYATWRVNLEFYDGDDFDRYKEFVDTYVGDHCAYDLGQYLSYEVDEAMDSNNETASSYARAFINDVNWTEIGKHALEALSETA